MPSNHLILCCPLLLPSIFPSIRIFSNESALHSRWPKYWSFGVSEFHNFWLSLPECRKMHRVAWAGIIWFLLILFVLQLDPYLYASILIIQSTIWNFWKHWRRQWTLILPILSITTSYGLTDKWDWKKHNTWSQSFFFVFKHACQQDGCVINFFLPSGSSSGITFSVQPQLLQPQGLTFG